MIEKIIEMIKIIIITIFNCVIYCKRIRHMLQTDLNHGVLFMGGQSLSKGEQRREKILDLLKIQGRVTVQEIIDMFQCSEATARRDLDLLEKTEPVVRTIGGALFEGFSGVREPSFQERKQFLWAEKEAIAAKAASLVEEGDIVGLTGGTTSYFIGKALKHMQGITVVTNAVNIAMELADSDGVQVVVTGGVMRNRSYELCGPLAETVIDSLNISKMFLGLDGITAEQGLTTYSELEAQIAKWLMKRSAQTIAVFDHTKVGRTSLFSIAPVTAIDACITNAGKHDDMMAKLADLNITLHLVGEQNDE